MPTRKVQVSCPNCRTPQTIEAQQVFDVKQEPQSKQRILTGTPNVIQCKACGYQGPVHMPLVYHDPDKQLLLTHVPPDLGLPMQEQERVVGPLITRVVESLPAEQRKAYLLQPKTMLTMQTMMDTILESEGVTKEMRAGQQARAQLLQRMANMTSDEALLELARQEDELVDREFFTILSTLANNAMASGDEALARRLVEVQQKILPVTSFGKEVQAQNEEIQAAAKDLQDLGEGITRESLLDLIIRNSSDLRLRAYVSMARGAMDYEFFRLLSERVDRARPDARPRLAELRQKLLELTSQYDAQVAQQSAQMKQVVDALLEEDDPGAIIAQNPDLVDDLFLNVVQTEIESAQESGDLDRSGKLQRLVDAINELAAPPPEFEVINRLVGAPDDDARNQILDSLSPEQLSSLVEMLTNILPQVEAGGDEQTIEAVKDAYRLALRRTMRMNINKKS